MKDSNDHDNLIRIETKLDNLTEDVKSLKLSTMDRINKLEGKVIAIDELHARVNPLDSVIRLNQLEIKIHDFYQTSNVYRTIAGVVGGAIFFILTQIPNWIKLFIK